MVRPQAVGVFLADARNDRDLASIDHRPAVSPNA